jgi:hypothetical protein
MILPIRSFYAKNSIRTGLLLIEVIENFFGPTTTTFTRRDLNERISTGQHGNYEKRTNVDK